MTDEYEIKEALREADQAINEVPALTRAWRTALNLARALGGLAAEFVRLDKDKKE